MDSPFIEIKSGIRANQATKSKPTFGKAAVKRIPERAAKKS